MGKVTAQQLKVMMLHVAQVIVENEPYLTEIDTVIGDGDHGTGMKRGFSALNAALETYEPSTVRDLFKAVGMELVKTMGGASGVIFGTMFIGGLDCLPQGMEVGAPELAAFFTEGMEAIERRGKARPGQKTMLDALAPAVDAMKRASSGTPRQALEAAYKAALEGVEASKSMQSRVGRSKNFREESLGLPDPGAVSTSLIFRALYEAAPEA